MGRQDDTAAIRCRLESGSEGNWARRLPRPPRILEVKRYEDWVLDDPAGQDIDVARPIRDEIRRRVEQLITELQPVSSGAEGS